MPGRSLETQVQNQVQQGASALSIPGPPNCSPFSPHNSHYPPLQPSRTHAFQMGQASGWPTCCRPIPSRTIPSSGKTMPKPGPAQVRKAMGSISMDPRIPPNGITVTDHNSPNSSIKKPLQVGAMSPQGIQHPAPHTSALLGSRVNIGPPQMALDDARTNISG